MTILLEIVGILVGCLFFGKRRKKAAITIWGATAIALTATACGPVAQGLVSGLQADYATSPAPRWGAKNVIVVLGLGTEQITGATSLEVGSLAYGRLAKALELYRSCKQGPADCRVLVSGGDSQRHGQAEATVYANALVRIGVERADLLLEDRSSNTWENARNSATVLGAIRPDRTVLVTSGVHMRRSLQYFAYFGIEPVPARSDYLSAIPSILPLSFNLTVADIALHEYAGMVRFHLYNVLGLNQKAAHAG